MLSKQLCYVGDVTLLSKDTVLQLGLAKIADITAMMIRNETKIEAYLICKLYFDANFHENCYSKYCITYKRIHKRQLNNMNPFRVNSFLFRKTKENI